MRKEVYVALAVVVGTLAVGGFVMARRHHPRLPPKVTVLHAIVDGAIAAGDRDEGGGWIARLDSDGNVMWTADVTGMVVPFGRFDGITVADHAVAVRVFRETELANHRWEELQVFELDDGSPRWSTALVHDYAGAAGRAVGQSEMLADFAIADGFALAVRDVDGSTQLRAFDARSGKPRWHLPLRRDASREPARVLVNGEHAVIVQSFESQVVDLVRGTARVIPQQVGCLVGGDLAYLAAGQTQLVRVHVDGSPVSTAAYGMDGTVAKACAEYHGVIAMLLRHDDSDTTTIALMTTAGSIVRSIELTELMPDTAVWTGALTRFVPYPSQSDYTHRQLQMLDLERGEIAWTSVPIGPEFSGALVRGEARWVTTNGTDGLLVFDGDTGVLAGALEAPWIDRAMRAAQVGGGRAWRYGTTAVSGERHEISVIDLASVTVSGGGRAATVTTAKVRDEYQLQPTQK